MLNLCSNYGKNLEKVKSMCLKGTSVALYGIGDGSLKEFSLQATQIIHSYLC